jgi:hypothetical protein
MRVRMRTTITAAMHAPRCAGDHASMIFRLLPDVQLYPAMGINSNIQARAAA